MQKLLHLLIVLLPLISNSQIIPSASRVDWSKAGLEGNVPQYANTIDVTSLGAIPNDSIDDSPVIAMAIDSLHGTAGVIYFPAGNYLVRSTISLPDSVIIRGAGSDSTTLSFNFIGNGATSFEISSNPTDTFHSLLSGYLKDSNRLVVDNSDTSFKAGDRIEIREANGAWDIQPASWANYSVGHLSRIDSVNADTIWLNEALRIDFDSVLHPEIRKIYPRQMCGLECFKMVRVDSNTTGSNYGINFRYATNCWIRGVESDRGIFAHVAVDASSHIQISGCYFHDALLYDGTSTRGYGVMLIEHAGSNLIEDNIFKHLRHAMITKQGANGNVWGYNYSLQPNRSEPIADYSADMCMHGHYAFANLYEGNIGQNLQIDIVWGPSGPYNTFFRNKVELYGIIMSSGAVQSDKQNFVGNDITSTQFLQANYTLTGTGHFQSGNNVKGTITPSGTGTLIDTSYYLDSIPPLFWNLTQSIPTVGIPNTFAADNNPAHQRYNNGGVMTLCAYPVRHQDTTVTTSLQSLTASAFEIKNCVANKENINLTIASGIETSASVELISVIGQTLAQQSVSIHEGISSFSIPSATLSAGIYFIRIVADRKSYSRKVVLE